MKLRNLSRATNQLQVDLPVFPSTAELQLPDEEPALEFELSAPRKPLERADFETEQVHPSDVPLIPAWVLREDWKPPVQLWRRVSVGVIVLMVVATLVLWLVSSR